MSSSLPNGEPALAHAPLLRRMAKCARLEQINMMLLRLENDNFTAVCPGKDQRNICSDVTSQ